MRILIVEDDPRMASVIARGLREEAYAVDTASDGEQAVYLASETPYDAIVLDVMLPVKDGYAVCRELRSAGLRMPVLMLTALDAVDDRVTGLDSGADDYLTKPFDFKELLARLRALRRRAAEFRPPVARVADLVLDTGSRTVRRGADAVVLTAKEYALLEYLVLNAGRVIGREEIAQHVWDGAFDPMTNLIDVYVKRLREKLEAGGRARLIQTRRGEGYLLREEPGATDD